MYHQTPLSILKCHIRSMQCSAKCFYNQPLKKKKKFPRSRKVENCLSSSHLNLLSLDRVPRHQDGAEQRQRTKSSSDVKGIGNGAVVGLAHNGDKLGLDGLGEASSAVLDDVEGVEAGSDEVGGELVLEDVLGDADEESTAEGLGEHHDGGADSNVSVFEGGLDGNHGLLHADADTEAEEDLVADPFAVAGVDFKGGEETSTNGHHDGRGDHEGCVVSEEGDETTRDDGHEDDGQNHGNVLNTGLDGGCALNGLEPDGEVEDHDEEGGTESGSEPGTGPDCTVLEDAGRDSGSLLLPDLDTDESSNENAEENKQGDDAAVAPGELGATPLQGEEEGDNTGDEEESTLKIERENLVLDGRLLESDLALGDLEEQNDEASSDGTKGQVNVEAPSPSQVVSESTAHERTGDRGNTVHGANDTHVARALLERNTAVDDEESSGEDARSTETSDGTAENETDRVRGGSADERSEFEQEDGAKEDPFDRVVGVEFTEDEGDGAGGEEVRGSVPAYVFESVEIVSNARDGSGNNCVILEISLAGVSFSRERV